MEEFTDEQKQEAQSAFKFYTDLIETNTDMAKYYISENVVLDWFGKSVKGEKNVNIFLKSDVSKVRHYFSDPMPTNKIEFRDIHVIKDVKTPTARRPKRRVFPSILNKYKTPGDDDEEELGTLDPSTSSYISSNLQSIKSPVKRLKPSGDGNDFLAVRKPREERQSSSIGLKYATASGCVEFHRPSLKKLQSETKWKRPCKLNIGYTCLTEDISKDITIYLIIYESNIRCRRNLLSDFEAGEPEN